MTAQFPDGVWFFDLAPHSGGEEWLRVLGALLAVPATAIDELISGVATILRGRRALLLLDNCDRVAAQAGEHVIALLRATDSIKVLATSQARLNFAGEQTFRVPPLALPPRTAAGSFREDEVGQSPAVQLLVTRMRAVVPEFELAPGNAATIAEICHRLDGMPLALELAATRFMLLSPEQVLERIVQRFRFLGSDAAGRDMRHRSLLSLLEWSYALLSAKEQQLLNWCTVFVQTWSVEATMDLAAAFGYAPETAIDLLTGLVNRSLVSVAPGAIPPRYRLLETVREYALDRLRASGEEDRARNAHLEIIERICRAAHEAVLAGRMPERIAQLTQDRGNIVAALDWALPREDRHPAAMSIVGSLVLYARAHGDYAEMGRFCARVVNACASSDTPERARALLTYGVLRVHLDPTGHWDDTILPEAARIAAKCGDWWTEAFAHGYQTLGLANRERLSEAEKHVAVTELSAHQHDNGLLRGLAGLARGWIHLARGESHAALERLMSVSELGPDLFLHHFINVYIALVQLPSERMRALRAASSGAWSLPSRSAIFVESQGRSKAVSTSSVGTERGSTLHVCSRPRSAFATARSFRCSCFGGHTTRLRSVQCKRTCRRRTSRPRLRRARRCARRMRSTRRESYCGVSRANRNARFSAT